VCHPSRDECLGHVASYGWSIGWSVGASTLGSLPTNGMEFHSSSSEYIRVRHPLREVHIWLRWRVASDWVRVWVRAHIHKDMWFLFMTITSNNIPSITLTNLSITPLYSEGCAPLGSPLAIKARLFSFI